MAYRGQRRNPYPHTEDPYSHVDQHCESEEHVPNQPHRGNPLYYGKRRTARNIEERYQGGQFDQADNPTLPRQRRLPAQTQQQHYSAADRPVYQGRGRGRGRVSQQHPIPRQHYPPEERVHREWDNRGYRSDQQLGRISDYNEHVDYQTNVSNYIESEYENSEIHNTYGDLYDTREGFERETYYGENAYGEIDDVENEAYTTEDVQGEIYDVGETYYDKDAYVERYDVEATYQEENIEDADLYREGRHEAAEIYREETYDTAVSYEKEIYGAADTYIEETYDVPESQFERQSKYRRNPRPTDIFRDKYINRSSQNSYESVIGDSASTHEQNYSHRMRIVTNKCKGTTHGRGGPTKRFHHRHRSIDRPHQKSFTRSKSNVNDYDARDQQNIFYHTKDKYRGRRLSAGHDFEPFERDNASQERYPLDGSLPKNPVRRSTGLLRTPSISPVDNCTEESTEMQVSQHSVTKDRCFDVKSKGLLPTPEYIESYSPTETVYNSEDNHKDASKDRCFDVKSKGLLPTPEYIESYSPNETVYNSEDNHKDVTKDRCSDVNSKGLLPTPEYIESYSPNETVYNTEVIHKDNRSKGLLLTPRDSEVKYSQEIVYSELHNLGSSSKGLLSTPDQCETEYLEETGTPGMECSQRHIGIDASTEMVDSSYQALLLKPQEFNYESQHYKLHPQREDSASSTTCLLSPLSQGGSQKTVSNKFPTQAVKVPDEFPQTISVSERVVERVTHPSKGLLPTPPCTPSLPDTNLAVFESNILSGASDREFEKPHIAKQDAKILNENLKEMESFQEDLRKDGSVSIEEHRLPQNRKHTKAETVTQAKVCVTKTINESKKQSATGKQTEAEILENIKVQIELAKALENMQKTMTDLQKKINEDSKVQKKQVKLRRDSERKEAITSRKEAKNEQVVLVTEGTDKTEKDNFDTETLSSSSNTHKLADIEEPINTAVSLDHGGSIETPRAIEDDTNQPEPEPQNNVVENSTNVQPLKDTDSENTSRNTIVSKPITHAAAPLEKRPTRKIEFKTYKEWRLAKERMHKSFHERNFENKNNLVSCSDRNQSINSEEKNKLKRGQATNLDSKISISESVNDSERKQSEDSSASVDQSCAHQKDNVISGRSQNSEKDLRNSPDPELSDTHFIETNSAIEDVSNDNEPHKNNDSSFVAEKQSVKVNANDNIDKLCSNPSGYKDTTVENFKESSSEKAHSHEKFKCDHTTEDRYYKKVTNSKGHGERHSNEQNRSVGHSNERHSSERQSSEQHHSYKEGHKSHNKYKHSSGRRDSSDKRKHDKHESSHRDKHHHSKSSSSHRSKDHDKDRYRDKGSHSESSRKHSSKSSSDKSHRHDHKSHHSSKERRFSSSVRNDNDTSAKVIPSAVKESEKSVFDVFTAKSIGFSSNNNTGPDKKEQRDDFVENVSNSIAVQDDIIDVEGDVDNVVRALSGEDKTNVGRDTCLETASVKRNVTHAFVKLYDIRKSTEEFKECVNSNQQKSNPSLGLKQTNKTNRDENIFEKMIQDYSPTDINKESNSLKRENDDKHWTKLETSGIPFKLPLTDSESSSTDIDPFEKMNNFLNKKKSSTLISKVSSEEMKRFVVSDDQVSDIDSLSSPIKLTRKNEKPYVVKNKSQGQITHLKRLPDCFYRGKFKLKFPKIQLKRLKHSDVKKLKANLKRKKLPMKIEKVKEKLKHLETIDEKTKSDKNVTKKVIPFGSYIVKDESLNSDVTQQFGKESDTNKSTAKVFNSNNVPNRTKEPKCNFDGFSVPAYRAEKPKTVVTAYKMTASCSEVGTVNSIDSEKSCVNDQKCSANKLNKNETIVDENIALDKDQNKLDQNVKKYKRILSVACSSTEQSESSDVERVVLVSQREKTCPIISGSDAESVELEGSLGSEDSTCFEVITGSDMEEDRSNDNEERNELSISMEKREKSTEKTEESLLLAESSVEKTEESVVETDDTVSDVSIDVSDENLSKPTNSVGAHNVECKGNTREVEKPIFYSDKGGFTQNQENSFKKEHIKSRRNIFLDVALESTASETEICFNQTETGTESKKTSVMSSFAKVRANLGNTLKHLKIDKNQTRSSEESGDPDFCCLSERSARLLNEVNKEPSNTESNQSDQSFVTLQQVETNMEEGTSQDKDHSNAGKSQVEKDEEKEYLMTCSESAGKSTKRRKFDDSSTDTSDEEQLNESGSASKYRKRHQVRESEEKTSMRKVTDGSCNETPQKRTFVRKFRTQTNIMQMDGNADLMLGPPDESSGDEGDIEDNISVFNIESEDDNSASQDLFDNANLKVMSQNFKNVFAKANPDTKVTEGKHVRYANKNKDLTAESKSHENVPSTSTRDTKALDSTSDKEMSSNSKKYGENDSENIINNNSASTNAEDSVKEVKDEPDWLKNGYTQELDIIFLSDDDEMVMSVSQVPILLSDDETQDPDQTEDLVLNKVKEEKVDDDATVYEAFDTSGENYSSNDDWSDQGSDFEPENLFNSLKRAHNNANAETYDQNQSENSLFSDEDIFMSQTLLDQKDERNKSDGFESSDGAVGAVNEDELLGSPTNDERSMMSLNDKEFVNNTAVSNKKNVELKKMNDSDQEWSSDSEEILLLSTIQLENQHKNDTLKEKESSNKIKEENEINMNEGSFGDDTQPDIEDDSINISARFEEKPAEISNLSDEKLEERSTVKECQEMTPYLCETQVDQIQSDEDSNNSFAAFDFYSEHFPDSDPEVKQVAKIGSNLLKHSKSNKYEYETLSDDSDIMILENPVNDAFMKSGSGELLPQNDEANEVSDARHGLDVYLDQTQVDDSHAGGRQDINACENKERSREIKANISKNVDDVYLDQTQVAISPSADSQEVKTNNVFKIKTNSSKSVFEDQMQSSQHSPFEVQTQVDQHERSPFDMFTQEDNQVPAAYMEQTQVYIPENTDMLHDNSDVENELELLSLDSYTDEDPQSLSYVQNSSFDKNTFGDKRFCKNLNITVESFSDESQGVKDNVYDLATQVDSVTAENGQRNDRKGKFLFKKAVAKSQGKPYYNVITEVVSSDEDSFKYGANLKERSLDKSNHTDITKTSANDNAYLAATQFENNSESENESENDIQVYDIATQADRKKDQYKKSNPTEGKSRRGVFEFFDTSEAYLNKDSVSKTSLNSNLYQAATQYDDVSEVEETDMEMYNVATQRCKTKTMHMREDSYSMATQKDTNDTSYSDFIEEISNDEDTGNNKRNNANQDSVTDIFDTISSDDGQSDVYQVATQVLPEETRDKIDIGDESSNNNKDVDTYEAATQPYFDDISEPEQENIDEDFYNLETQVDTGFELDADNYSLFDILGKSVKGTDRLDKTTKEESDNGYKSNENKMTKTNSVDVIDDDLPDIESEWVHKAVTQTVTKITAHAETTTSNLLNRSDGSTDMSGRPVPGARSILKRPMPGTSRDKIVRFEEVSQGPVIKKPRLSTERTALQIEPQKMKTIGEKRASGIRTGSWPATPVSSVIRTDAQADIQVLDVPESRSWLSKGSVPKKGAGKDREIHKKRKRQGSNAEDLRARMVAARLQVKERFMHNVTHPDTVKRLKTAQTESMTDLGDVTLPSDSQIIEKGLPLLNPTGLLLKPHTSDHSTTDDHNTGAGLANSHVAIATISTATTTISTAVCSSGPCSVGSSVVNVTTKIQPSTSYHDLNQKDTNRSGKHKSLESNKNNNNLKHAKDTDRQELVNKGKKGDKENRVDNRESQERRDNSKTDSDRYKQKHDSGRNKEKHDSGRNKEKHDSGRNKEKHDSGRNKEKHDSGRNKEKHDSGRNKEKHDSGRNKEKHDSGRNKEKGDSRRNKEKNHSDRNKEKHDSDRNKEKHDSGRNDSGRNKDKHHSDRNKEKHDSGKNKVKLDSGRNKEKHDSHKDRNKEKHHSGKDGVKPNDKSKDHSDRNKEKHDRGKDGREPDDKRKDHKNKSAEKENKHQSNKSVASKKLDKDKHENKRDDRSDKDRNNRRSSSQDKNRDKNSSSRLSDSDKIYNDRTNEGKCDKDMIDQRKIGNDKSNDVTPIPNTGIPVHTPVELTAVSINASSMSLEMATIPAISKAKSVGLNTTVSTSTSTAITLSSVNQSRMKPTSAGALDKPRVSTSRPMSAVTMVTTTTASVSRNAAWAAQGVQTTSSTHIQSSVLLQKQPSRSGTAGPNVSSGRQPLLPVVSNSSIELLPANMLACAAKKLLWHDFLKVILKWSPNWFEERAQMEQTNRRAPPPDVTTDLFGTNGHTLYPLVERYENFKEYSERFMLPLLLYETWESCYSTWREKKTKGKLCQHKLMFSHQTQGGEKLFVYTLLGLMSKRDRGLGNYVNEGDLVKMTMNGSLKVGENTRKDVNYTISGFVDNVYINDVPVAVDRICGHFKEMGEIRKQLGDCVSLKLVVKVRYRKFVPNEKAVINLECVSTITNTWRQFTALAALPRSLLCKDLMYPTGNMTYCDKAPAMVNGLQEKYNPSQLTAINTAAKIACLPPEISRVCLLQGPPGTGKSHTIVGIVKHIVKVTRGRCRICLCAPSHAAVDELLRRLNKENRTIDKAASIRMVRLGKKNKVHTEIQSHCLDFLVQKNIQQVQKEELLKKLPQSLQGERNALEKKIAMVTKSIAKEKDQYKKKKLTVDLKNYQNQKDNLESKYNPPRSRISPQEEKKAKSLLLQRAHVIAGTLSSMGGSDIRSEFQNKKGPAFQVVIIDEATQAIELETLIPLQYGVSKLILVGDPEQLPATVLSQVAIDNKFNMSLFERLDSHFRFKDVNPVILLDTQYRMDPEISAFPNKYIYDGRIKDDRCVKERNAIPLVPYLLFDVCEGRELFSQGSRSMSNPLEAVFTAELCKYIVQETSVIERVIGIIAPYTSQKSEIKKELEKRNLSAIEVSTVDGFQGREKYVIVMSCVRANTAGTVGFVGNRNRMNVSLTRAKYAMYLVGHFEALESSDEWKALIADARQRGKIIPVDQSSMKRAIKKTVKQRRQ